VQGVSHRAPTLRASSPPQLRPSSCWARNRHSLRLTRISLAQTNEVDAQLPGSRVTEVVLCVSAAAFTFCAWLLAPLVAASWALAAAALVCAGIASLRRGKVRGSYGLGVVLLILVTFALPIWGSHSGELPPRGALATKHAHAIWELGHVH